MRKASGRIPIILAIMICLLITVGCDTSGDLILSDGDTTDGDTTDGDATDGDASDGDASVAFVRAVQLSADSPEFDVIAGGEETLFEDLSFSESTDFAKLEVGTVAIDFIEVGGDGEDAVLSLTDITLTDSKRYTVVAFDLVASIKGLVMEEDFDAPVDGNIKLRPVHVASDTGDMNIWRIPYEGDATLLADDLAFGAFGEYVELPAGGSTVGVDIDADESTDFNFVIAPLPAGTIANLFVISEASGLYFLMQTRNGEILRIDGEGTTN